MCVCLLTAGATQYQLVTTWTFQTTCRETASTHGIAASWQSLTSSQTVRSFVWRSRATTVSMAQVSTLATSLSARRIPTPLELHSTMPTPTLYVRTMHLFYILCDFLFNFSWDFLSNCIPFLRYSLLHSTFQLVNSLWRYFRVLAMRLYTHPIDPSR